MNANAMTQQTEQAGYTLVVGLGKTGLSVVRHLRAHGERVVVADSRDIPPGLGALKQEFADVECSTGSFDTELFRKAARIIASPGVALSEPALAAAIEKDVEVIGDIDLFAEYVSAPVVAITGSNGKSTVTELVTQMAKRAGIEAVACGNIGLPVLDALDESVGLYVIELSSFQLETLRRLPMKAAVVLNVTADHLDRYDSMASYAQSKQRIYRNAETCVINLDDALAKDTGAVDCNCIGFTMGKPAEDTFGIENGHVCLAQQQLIAIGEIAIKGSHNIQNAMAALALGGSIGLPMGVMLETLRDFQGLEHRMQFVASIGEVDWVNDSKATNVGATIASLTGLAGKHVLIAGGIAKDADFSPLHDVVHEHCRAVVLLGRDADRIAAAMPDDIHVERCDDMQQAVVKASELAQAGDNVILAPACASFDMFDNFEHRGEVFMQAVTRLAAEVRA
jgi:UDP-N-acetylmuramoylalanine--D-glutamate ligase